MKKLFTQKLITGTLFAGVLFNSSLSFGQLFTNDCIDLSLINANIENYNDDANYPAESVIYSSGDFEIIKTKNSDGNILESTVFYPSSDVNQLNFASWLTINVEKLQCSNKSLFLTANVKDIIIDGDTIPKRPYSTDKFSVGNSFHNGSEIMIEGEFEKITIGGSTSSIFGICLSYTPSCPPTSSNEIVKDVIASDVYPNPSNGIFSIDLKQSNSLVQIFNSLGEVVYSENFNNKGKTEIAVDAPGIYLVSITSNGINQQQKLVVK